MSLSEGVWSLRAPAALRGGVRVPGDKSISHRALLLGALADGDSQLHGFLPAGDCRATLGCVRDLGIQVEMHSDTSLTVHGRGLHGLRAPASALNCVRSGTTMRLLTGILAGQPFDCTLTGDSQLLRRPMRRITDPLARVGAEVVSTEGHAPLQVYGRALRGGAHDLQVASAQVKSALLLAGLYADGPTLVRQCGPSRDHTERMLSRMGAPLTVDGLDVTLLPPGSLAPLSLYVPGDFSSAAYFLVAGALAPGSQLTIRGVGINPTRTGLLDVLRAMGAQIEVENVHEQGGEPVADLGVTAGPLRGVEVGGDTIVRMIDEFPILAVAATQARGETLVRDAAELRVKETDRIATVVQELAKMGARIVERDDGFIVSGPASLNGAEVNSHGDHRLAMALAVAGLVAEGCTTVQDTSCTADSFPGFRQVLDAVAQGSA